MKNSCLKLVSVLFFLTLVNGQPVLISPQNQDTLNYLHIPFKWSQTPGTIDYQMQISSDIEFENIIYNSFQPFLLELVTDIFDWNSQYFWRCRSYFSDESYGEWSNISRFSTFSLPDELFNLNTIIYEPDLVYNGITILDQLWSGHIFAIDLDGKPLLFVNSNQVFDDGFSYQLGFTYLLNNGNIIGYADGRENNLPGRAFEMDLNNQIVWQGPGNLEGIGVHHDVIRLPNGNTMAITSKDMLLPIPDADWPIDVDSSIVWRGDRILEWDQDGNEVWSWNSFDHYSLDDWDYNQILQSFGLGFYDWTHSNAIWYDELDNAIYLSVRYLNRISKIDYESGNILWNMGEDTPSGDSDFGYDLNFSMQHSVKVLDNRNIMIYDNGNDFAPIQSRGLEIEITETDSIPIAEIFWEYNLPDSVSSGKMSDCDRLPNGNTLLTSSHSKHLLEISQDLQKVWEVLPYQEFSTYRGERVLGLYPQLFSIIQPDFTEIDGEVMININQQQPTLSYTIVNHGYNDQEYIYILEDLNGWFPYNGNIEVLSGQSQDIVFVGEINNNPLNNILTFSIYPIDAPDLIEIYTAQLDFELSIEEAALPEDYFLLSAYPNPFNSSVQFELKTNKFSLVDISIIDINGKEIDRLNADKNLDNNFKAVWDAKNFPSGIYFVRLYFYEKIVLKKITLLK